MNGLPQAWLRAWGALAAESDELSAAARALPLYVGPQAAWVRPCAEDVTFEFTSAELRAKAAGHAAWFRGEAADVAGPARRFLDQVVVAGPNEAPLPIALGGRAFARGPARGAWSELDAASLVVPRVLIRDGWATLLVRPGERVDALLDRVGRDWTSSAGAGADVRGVERSERTRFEAAVRAAVERIRAGELDKVVLTRTTRLEGKLSASSIIDRLSPPDSRGASFAIGFGPRTFVGATPELLVRRRSGRVEIDALAGTAPPEAEGMLLVSAKEAEEHRRVVEHVAGIVRSFGVAPEHEPEPELRRLGYVTHLWTPIVADDAERDVWAWADALHPTPAVGGLPLEPARALIERLETHDRGWYCGGVGWIDARGDGEMFVALRSALIEPDHATLFVGAGVVAGSDPTAEWEETLLKERAMLRAFGSSPSPSAARGVMRGHAVRADPD